MEAFELEIHELDDGCCELEIVGGFDLDSAGQVQEALEQRRAARLLFNLEGCEFIDSTGIAVIVQAVKDAQANSRGLAVFGLSGQVERTLAISGLADRDFVQPDRAAAVNHVRSSKLT